jgi:nucleoside-diphosphate-sugar epimerase
MKSTEQETILVTGATGTLGSEVVKQLSENKSDVKVKAAVHSIENVKKKYNTNGLKLYKLTTRNQKVYLRLSKVSISFSCLLIHHLKLLNMS